jgi:hypothetical protein
VGYIEMTTTAELFLALTLFGVFATSLNQSAQSTTKKSKNHGTGYWLQGWGLGDDVIDVIRRICS